MPTPSPFEELIPVDLVSLGEDSAEGNPVVILQDREGRRVLPIWIGDPEARAIDIVLNKIKTPRPLTHKLLISVVEGMGSRLSRVVIDRVTNHTYFASLYIQTPQGIHKIDSRPSDAITIALEAGVPIFVDRSVMEKAGQTLPPSYVPQQTKREMSREDFERMGQMLTHARMIEEEQAAGGEQKN